MPSLADAREFRSSESLGFSASFETEAPKTCCTRRRICCCACVSITILITITAVIIWVFATGKPSADEAVRHGASTVEAHRGVEDFVQATSSGLSLGSEMWGGGPRLVVTAAPADKDGGFLPAQKMVLDTGSSTLAFCQSSFLQAADYSKTRYLSCNQYNPGGASTGYWGPFVQGSLKIAGALNLPRGLFSIMQQEVSMPCTEGFNGIFGIAFKQIDMGFQDAEQPDWPQGHAGSCPVGGPRSGLVPPLMQGLQAAAGIEKIGIYWSGQAGEDVGRLYFDDSATSNEHYTKASVRGPAVLGELGWYDITVDKISLGDNEWTGLQCNPRQPGDNCIMDTGTPSIVLPAQVYSAAKRLMEAGESATLTFWLASAADGAAVPVTFDLSALSKLGALSPGSSESGFILGLPLWAFYYTVFDLTDRSVYFAPRQGTPPAPSDLPTTTMPSDVGEGYGSPVWNPDPNQAPFPGTSPEQVQPLPGPFVPWGELPQPWTIGYEGNATLPASSAHSSKVSGQNGYGSESTTDDSTDLLGTDRGRRMAVGTVIV